MEDFILNYNSNDGTTIAYGNTVYHSKVKPNLSFSFNQLYCESATNVYFTMEGDIQTLLTDKQINECKNYVENYYETGDFNIYAYDPEDNNFYKGFILKSEAKSKGYKWTETEPENEACSWNEYAKKWKYYYAYITDSGLLQVNIDSIPPTCVLVLTKAEFDKFPKQIHETDRWDFTNEKWIDIRNLEQLKTTRKSFGENKYIAKERDDWVICENTHDAIISKEDYEKVQEIIKKNDYGAGSPYKYSIFNGIIKCADCGRAMAKQDDNRRSKHASNYYCSTHLRSSNICSMHKIKTEKLEAIVKDAIHLQVKLVIELDKSIKKLFFKNNEKSYEEEYKNNVRICEIKINGLKDRKRDAYKEWKFNNIEKNEYEKLSNEIDNQINILNEKIILYESTYKETIKRIRKDDYWIGHYKKNKNIKKLTKGVVNELIELIRITEDGDVLITFKYQDEYDNLVKYLEGEEAKENEKVDSRSLSKTFS